MFQKPDRIKSTVFTLLSRSNQLKFPRIGLVIPKKYIKYSHERNWIKRHARETFRIYQHSLLFLDFVLIVHSKKVLYLENKILIKELQKLWKNHFKWQ